MKGLLKLLKWLCLAVLIFCVAYGAVAVACAFFPKTGRPQQQGEANKPVYICGDAVHTDIAIPLDDPAFDWEAAFGPAIASRLKAKPTRLNYVFLGWGDVIFFEDIPTVWDASPAAILGALSGQQPTSLRLMLEANPQGKSDCEKVTIDQAGRKALFNHMMESRQQPVTEAPPGPQTAPDTIYILSNKRYSPFYTCNEWIAEGLAAAGLPHAMFSPFSFSIRKPLQGWNDSANQQK